MINREEERANKEKASPLGGEAGGSGAGELLCSVTSCSACHSQGGACSGSAENEGDGEGSGLLRGGSRGHTLPIGEATEAEERSP